jgi:hypothetical protein
MADTMHGTMVWAGSIAAVLAIITLCTLTDAISAHAISRAVLWAQLHRAISASEPFVTVACSLDTVTIVGTGIGTEDSTAVVPAIAIRTAATSPDALSGPTAVRALLDITRFPTEAEVARAFPFFACALVVAAVRAGRVLRAISTTPVGETDAHPVVAMALAAAVAQALVDVPVRDQVDAWRCSIHMDAERRDADAEHQAHE